MPKQHYNAVKMLALRPNALEAWRDNRKLSQAQLAELAGLSRATVNRIEKGHAESITFDTINRLAEALSIDADALVMFR